MNALALLRRMVMRLALALIACGAAHAGGPVDIPSQDGKLHIPGYWFETGDKTPQPVIIGLHGCGGALDSKGNFAERFFRYAGYFNAERMHFLALDSFTPRGQKSICETPNNRRTIHEADRREDVFAAINWLARQPNVDASRIVVMGWSHGAQTLLSTIDATDKYVQAQKFQPRAAVAFYPGCLRNNRMWDYEVHMPLLIMIGALDDWTLADECVTLKNRLARNRANAPVDLVVYPGNYHGFDGVGPVRIMEGLGNTKSGKAMVGGNPAAREASHARMFDFLSAQLGQPLLLTHAQRFKGHHYVLPTESGFAAADDVNAVPLSDAGKARYAHYRSLPSPKAFAVTEKGGWYFSAGEPEAMAATFRSCEKARSGCWLYAVDDRVVWNTDVATRYGVETLRRLGSQPR
ncbi:MAG: dienelactone hydrolase family protein [Pseudomonadota bacterium]